MTHMFDDLVDKIIATEGGYSNHASDAGGETRFGITHLVARRYGYRGDMKLLPLSLAKQIYKERYWNALNLSRIERVAPSIVEELLDTGVNQGVGRAAEYLQMALNAFNGQERDYMDVVVDGDIGPQTLAALRQFIERRGYDGEVVLLRALNVLQGSFYLQLSQRRKSDEDFVYGWIKNRVVI